MPPANSKMAAVVGTPETPKAEVHISAELVTSLLAAQAPQYDDLPVKFVGSGWDNETYRLGQSLAVRMPRREASLVCLRNEQQWLQAIPEDLGIAIPRVVFYGNPAPEFRWPWSVVPWFEGSQLGIDTLAAGESKRLGTFFRRLHQPTPGDAPSNPYRGGNLQLRTWTLDQLREHSGELERRGIDIDQIYRHWDIACNVDRPDQQVWLHGDPHPKNLISRKGKLAAVIDWGDICAGDAPCDLNCAWMLFDRLEREQFFAAYGPVGDDAMRLARGWAIGLGMMLFTVGFAGDAIFATVGERTMRRIASDAL